jgi:CrcB protein
MLGQFAAVAVGGALGAMCRFAVYTFLPMSKHPALPWPTLFVNVGGSFIAGLLLVWLSQAHPEAVGWRLLLVVGFLGAFTTFSAFSIDTWLLLDAGRWAGALVNALLNLVLSVGACVGAVFLARSVYH